MINFISINNHHHHIIPLIFIHFKIYPTFNKRIQTKIIQ
jgi:hypothetical protein